MPHEDPDQDPLLGLAGELRTLSTRLLGVADALLARATTAAPGPARAPDPVPPAHFQPSAPFPAASRSAYLDGPPMPAPRLPPRRKPEADWDRLGSRLLAWVGGAITILGVVLLLVLASQRGWLGPIPRLLSGLGFAAVLLGLGWRVHRTPSGLVGGFALTATGIAAVYLDVVAATALYAYLPVAAGLLAGLVVAVAGLLLSDRWDAPALAVFVVLAAAACAPIITAGVTPLLVAFLLVLAGAATPVQLRRSWRRLAVAAYLPVLVASLVLDQLTPSPPVTATVAIAAVTMLGLLGLALATARADEPLAVGLLVAAPIPIMAATPLLTRPWAVGALAAVSVLLFAIWVAGRFGSRFTGVAGAAGTVTLFQAIATATIDNTAIFTGTVLGEAILLAAAAYRVRGRGTLAFAALYAAVGLAAALAGPLPLPLLINAPLGNPGTALLRTGAIIAALLTATALVVAAAVTRLGAGRPAVWLPLGALGLYGFSGAVLCLSMLVAPDQQGFLTGHVLVTVGWTACALPLLVRGIDALPARMAGLALVAAALVKLFLFDLATLDGITRVAAFLGSGLVLLAAGVRYARAVAAHHSIG